MGRIKEWEELTICDNFLFQKVMQNPRLCKRLIEKLLCIKVKNITYPDAEKTLEISPTQKGIRLNLYVETDTGVLLDIDYSDFGITLRCNRLVSPSTGYPSVPATIRQ